MRELSFMGPSNDGQRLLLVSDDGTEFELVVDDRLISVVSREHGTSPRKKPTTSPAVPMPSPREIQDRVRHGASIEEIAQAADVSPEQVARFAYPVITERTHVANQAREALVPFGPDHVSLEQAVAARIRIRGVDPEAIRWDAWRRSDARWTVVAAYPAAQGDRIATFEFGITDRSITAIDDEARWLLEEGPTADRSIPTGPTSASPGLTRPTSVPDHVESIPNDRQHDQHGAEQSPPTTEAKAHRGWDQAHPAARAQQRRDSAADSSHPAGSASRNGNQNQRAAEAPEPPSAPTPPPAPAPSTPHWEELLFGTPRDEDQ